MSHFIRRYMVLVLLGGVLCHGQVVVSHAGRQLVSSSQRLSVGATYAPEVIRLNVDSRSGGDVRVWTGRTPKRIFLQDAQVSADSWSYEAASGTVALRLPAGRHAVQLRFDDHLVEPPFRVTLPVRVTSPGGRSVQRSLEGTCRDGVLSASMTWKDSSGGYVVTMERAGGSPEECLPVQGNEVQVEGAGQMHFLMQEAQVRMRISDWKKGRADTVITMLRLGGMGGLRQTNRLKLLSTPGLCKAEGEDFRCHSEVGVRVSHEHGNTSGGGCIYNWGHFGSRLNWVLRVPRSGRYRLGFVTAGEEPLSLRGLLVNGRVSAGVALVGFPSTGGWGRQAAHEWVAWILQSGGRDAEVTLSAGDNEISLVNLYGHHLNVDCLVALPVQ